VVSPAPTAASPDLSSRFGNMGAGAWVAPLRLTAEDLAGVSDDLVHTGRDGRKHQPGASGASKAVPTWPFLRPSQAGSARASTSLGGTSVDGQHTAGGLRRVTEDDVACDTPRKVKAGCAGGRRAAAAVAVAKPGVGSAGAAKTDVSRARTLWQRLTKH
jgi:hypothetical protein